MLFSKEDIEKLLPQKGILNLIDQATIPEKSSNFTLSAIKTLRKDDPILALHPWAYPATLLEEAVLQACQILALAKFPEMKNMLPAFKRSEKSIGVPVVRDDTLFIEVELTASKRNVYYFQGSATNQDGQKVIEVKNITAMVFPAKK